MRGASAKTNQELAGHDELETTLKYMHLAPGETDRAIALLNDRDDWLPQLIAARPRPAPCYAVRCSGLSGSNGVTTILTQGAPHEAKGAPAGAVRGGYRLRPTPIPVLGLGGEF